MGPENVRRFARRHRDWLLPAALACLLTTEVLLLDTGNRAVAVPAALVAASALVLRRRLPLVAFLLFWAGSWAVLTYAPAVDDGSVGYVTLFFFAVYALGRHTRGLEAWLGAGFLVAYMAFFVESDVGLRDAHASDVAFILVFVGAPWLAGTAVRIRGDREHVLAEENRRAVEDERARIARELHDVVSHAIAVTVLQARGARRMLGVDDEQARRALEAIEATNTSALSDMRRLLAVLRDPEGREADSPQPTLDRLDVLVDSVRASGVPVDLRWSGDPAPLPPGLDLSAYRIIQEALTNVIKHGGPGARATVEVGYGDHELEVTVLNDGAVPAPGRGHGLAGIRERVAVIGGTVEAGPRAGGGFALRARLPYVAEVTA